MNNKLYDLIYNYILSSIFKKHLAIASLFILGMSLIPIVYLSFYSHISSDDYSFGILTRHSYLNDSNVLEAAAKTVHKFYYSWQGTYSAIFIFALQPGIFGDKYYFLTTFVMLGTILFSISYFLYYLLVKILKIDKYSFIFINSIN